MNIEYIELRVKLLKILKSLAIDQISIGFFELVSSNIKNDYLSLSLEEPTYFSYAKKPQDVLDTRRRNKCGIGAYLHKCFGEYHSHAIIDNYRNKIFNKLQLLNNAFIIVEGDDIVSAYKDGFAYYSCMTNTDSYKFTQFYAKNNVKLLKYDDTYYRARALIFESICGKTVLDRIYPNSGPHICNIIEWAQKNNMWYRTHQSMPEYDSVEFTNGKDSTYLEISMQKNDIYPYMDSFSFTKTIGDTIILSSYNKNSNYCFRSTNGICLSKCGCNNWTNRRLDNEIMCENCRDNHDAHRCELCPNYITKGRYCENCQ